MRVLDLPCSRSSCSRGSDAFGSDRQCLIDATRAAAAGDRISSATTARLHELKDADPAVFTASGAESELKKLRDDMTATRKRMRAKWATSHLAAFAIIAWGATAAVTVLALLSLGWEHDAVQTSLTTALIVLSLAAFVGQAAFEGIVLKSGAHIPD